MTETRCHLRAAQPDVAAAHDLLFSRYPHAEWATFARFGWREVHDGLLLVLAELEPPEPGDLDDRVEHVRIREPYTLRVALAAETHPLAVGVMHSHPPGYAVSPSVVDDDMDGYFAQYFSDFAPDRPFVSLIIAQDLPTEGLSDTHRGDDAKGELGHHAHAAAANTGHPGPRVSPAAQLESPRLSGRVWWGGRWLSVTGANWGLPNAHLFLASPPGPPSLPETTMASGRILSRAGSSRRSAPRTHVTRLADAFGDDAAQRLAAATVAIVGNSGTGSPAAELAARAGVGRIILVDPDYFTASNLERIHGSSARDVERATHGVRNPKVVITRRHIRSIYPDCVVDTIEGRVPQPDVVDLLLEADVVLGCTDQHHSRLALADLALRYRVPIIDCGVGLEGTMGRVTGQVIRLVRFDGADPCPACRQMINPQRVAQELMSPAERAAAQAHAQHALAAGRDPNPYWRDEPQLNTVGYLTTIAGAMAIGYAIGSITGRFDMPFTQLQMNLSAPELEPNDDDREPRAACRCRRVRGWADQGQADALITAPSWWPAPLRH